MAGYNSHPNVNDRRTNGTRSAIIRFDVWSHINQIIRFPSGEMAKLWVSNSGSNPPRTRLVRLVSLPEPRSCGAAAVMGLASGVFVAFAVTKRPSEEHRKGPHEQ
jgi:hypothetical protein